MALLLSGERLRSRLQELIKVSKRIDIAVAWVTDWQGLDDLLSATDPNDKGSVRILTGVSGYITSPDALEKIKRQAQLRVYGDPSGVLFHPKLYIFHTISTSFVWIGSANLTRPAFDENVEIIAEQEDTDGKVSNHFQTLWKDDASSEKFDIDKYRKQWKKALKKRPKFLSIEAGVNIEVAASREVFDGEWDPFSAALNKTADLRRAMDTLDEGYRFVRRNWNEELTREDGPIMFGLKGKEFAHFGFLDRIYNSDRKNFIGPSLEAAKRRASIKQALSPLLAKPELDVKALQRSFDQLMAIPNCKRAFTTRLLIFARPESCVVLNKKSSEWLAIHFDVKLPAKPSGKQYSNLIEKIHQRDWWKSSMPSGIADQRIWKYRAALIDRFAFRDYERSKRSETNDQS